MCDGVQRVNCAGWQCRWDRFSTAQAAKAGMDARLPVGSPFSLLHALTFLFIFPFIFFPVLSFFAPHRLKPLPVGVAQALRVSSVHSNRQISCSSLSANPLASRGRHYNVEDVGRLAGRRAGETSFAPALSPLHLRRRHCLACNVSLSRGRRNSASN